MSRYNVIGRGLDIDERRQIDARLAVGRKPHDFPLITVGLETQKFRKRAVEKSDRVGERNGQNVFKPAIAPVPDGSRFPGPAPVHDCDNGFIEPGKRIRTDGVSQVMVYKTYLRAGWPELLREFLCPALLVPHAQEVQRRVQSVQVSERHFSRRVALQIVRIHGRCGLPAEADFVELFRTGLRKFQARGNCVSGKTRIVFQPAKALFRHRKEQLTVPHDARGRIMHLRVVNT